MYSTGQSKRFLRGGSEKPKISDIFLMYTKILASMCYHLLKVVTNEKGEALGEVLTIIC